MCNGDIGCLKERLNKIRIMREELAAASIESQDKMQNESQDKIQKLEQSLQNELSQSFGIYVNWKEKSVDQIVNEIDWISTGLESRLETYEKVGLMHGWQYATIFGIGLPLAMLGFTFYLENIKPYVNKKFYESLKKKVDAKEVLGIKDSKDRGETAKKIDKEQIKSLLIKKYRISDKEAENIANVVHDQETLRVADKLLSMGVAPSTVPIILQKIKANGGSLTVADWILLADLCPSTEFSKQVYEGLKGVLNSRDAASLLSLSAPLASTVDEKKNATSLKKRIKKKLKELGLSDEQADDVFVYLKKNNFRLSENDWKKLGAKYEGTKFSQVISKELAKGSDFKNFVRDLKAAMFNKREELRRAMAIQQRKLSHAITQGKLHCAKFEVYVGGKAKKVGDEKKKILHGAISRKILAAVLKGKKLTVIEDKENNKIIIKGVNLKNVDVKAESPDNNRVPKPGVNLKNVDVKDVQASKGITIDNGNIVIDKEISDSLFKSLGIKITTASDGGKNDKKTFISLDNRETAINAYLDSVVTTALSKRKNQEKAGNVDFVASQQQVSISTLFGGIKSDFGDRWSSYVSPKDIANHFGENLQHKSLIKGAYYTSMLLNSPNFNKKELIAYLKARKEEIKAQKITTGLFFFPVGVLFGGKESWKEANAELALLDKGIKDLERSNYTSFAAQYCVGL